MEVSGRRKDFSRSVSGASEEATEFYCDPCEHDGHLLPAEGYCEDSQECLCSACYKAHCRPAVWRHHRLQDQQSMPKIKPVSTVKDICTDICQKHNKTIEYFCKSHEHFGCSACMTTQHRICEKVDLIPERAAIFGSSKELNNLQRKLSELLTMNEMNKSDISKKSKAAVLQAERAKLQVKHLRATITDLFDKVEKKIEDSIEYLKGGDENKMTELAKEADIISQILQKHIYDIESCLNEKKMCQLFVEAKRTKEPLKDLSTKIANIGENSTIQRYQFIPNQIIVDMIKNVEKIGVLDIKDQHAKVPKFERDINVRAESDEKECKISGMHLLSGQLLVVVDYQNKSIKLIDIANNSVKSSYQTLNMTRPGDVAKVDVAQVAVTYPYDKKLQILDVTDSGSIKIQKEINANGQCFGVKCMGDNLIVSFIWPLAVKIISLTGAVIRTIDLDENIEYPAYVAVNPLKNVVYVSNWAVEDTGSVICMTKDGARKAVFEDEKFLGPHGAAVDTHGEVYVCGLFSNNVVQLSEDCSMIQELLNIDNGLNCPHCLALGSKNDELYIGMTGDNIKVFKLY